MYVVLECLQRLVSRNIVFTSVSVMPRDPLMPPESSVYRRATPPRASAALYAGMYYDFALGTLADPSL